MTYEEWVDNTGSCKSYKLDDNQTYAQCYYWQDRVEFFNVEEILSEIRYNISKPKKINEKISMSISDLKHKIEKDFLRLYEINKNIYQNAAAFIDDYIKMNNNPALILSNVKLYKQLKHIPLNKPMYSKKVLENKISIFRKYTDAKKKKILESDEYNYGGFRIENQKVTDDTIKCLITLVLDFPTLSSENYTAYINSPLGPNEKDQITPRTVSHYLHALRFTVNRATFSPPNRNSIGLRIYRVAWCKIIEKIIKKDYVLLGFIDEAAITVSEGRKYGRSYIGITPLANVPLTKVKCSIIALVLPGFGVLFEFINDAVNNLEYCKFLVEAVRFMRRYVCNNRAEIVIIEDNCPIHSTPKVEETIEKLKIALLPIVQYSPSLNELVEAYFGFMKSNVIQLTNETANEAALDDIKENWKQISNDKFNLAIAQSFYYDWISRMKICKRGDPVFTGHIDAETTSDVTFNHLQYVPVERIVEASA